MEAIPCVYCEVKNRIIASLMLDNQGYRSSTLFLGEYNHSRVLGRLSYGYQVTIDVLLKAMFPNNITKGEH